MGQESELKRLEQFVEKLLSKFSALQEVKRNLEKTLEEKDVLIDQLQSTLTTTDSRQVEVSQRLGSLVAKIEEWEQQQDEILDPTPEPAEPPEALGSEVEPGVDEEVQEDPIVEDAEEGGEVDVAPQEAVAGSEDASGVEDVSEEGRVQHNLFSLGGAK